MTPSFSSWFKAVIGIICLVMISLGTSSNDNACDSHTGKKKKSIHIAAFAKACSYNGQASFSQLRYEFGNWIPEAIRSVTIRLVSFSTPRSDFFVNLFAGTIIIDFPVYLLQDFKRAPDFVGFLFRLKPF